MLQAGLCDGGWLGTRPDVGGGAGFLEHHFETCACAEGAGIPGVAEPGGIGGLAEEIHAVSPRIAALNTDPKRPGLILRRQRRGPNPHLAAAPVLTTITLVAIRLRPHHTEAFDLDSFPRSLARA